MACVVISTLKAVDLFSRPSAGWIETADVVGFNGVKFNGCD